VSGIGFNCLIVAFQTSESESGQGFENAGTPDRHKINQIHVSGLLIYAIIHTRINTGIYGYELKKMLEKTHSKKKNIPLFSL
jgi:hypothetical protein